MNLVVLIFLYKRSNGIQIIDSILENSNHNIHIYHDGKRDSSYDFKWENIRNGLAKYENSERTEIFLQEENLGTDEIIPKGISHAFETYQSAIILEDDLHIGSDFVRWMEYMLNEYCADRTIGHIAGRREIQPNYPLSLDKISYLPVWGWGTWADSWLFFEIFKKLDYTEKRFIVSSFARSRKSLLEKIFWTFRGIEYLNIDKKQNWDCTWTYALYMAKQKSLISDLNRIEYLGVDTEAQHTIRNWNSFELREIDINQSLNFKDIFSKKLNSYYRNETRFANKMFGLTGKPLMHKMKSLLRFVSNKLS